MFNGSKQSISRHAIDISPQFLLLIKEIAHLFCHFFQNEALYCSKTTKNNNMDRYVFRDL